MKKTVALILVLLMALSLFGCSSGTTQPKTSETEQTESSKIDWPKKPIEIICCYNPGGDSDFNARAYAKRLESVLGQPVIVTNIAGTGGAVGSRQGKESDPDGYTVLMHHISMFVNQATGATDFGLDAFELAAIVGKNAGSVVAVNAKSPYKTLDDLVASSKENPGEVTFAANVGASTSVMATLFNRAGAKFKLVDLGDATERISSLLGGHVDAIPNAIGTTLPYIESGDMRALCIIEEERNPFASDIPTAIELGYEGCSLPIYYFFAFPKGTPSEIVDKFASACEEVSKMPDYQKEIKDGFLQTPYFKKGSEAKNILEKQQEYILNMKDELMNIE